MAAGRPRDHHEELRVKVEQARREVLPAVQLEKKEIKMVLQAPQMSVPSIVMTTVDDGSRAGSASTSPDADRIVGIAANPVAKQSNGFATAPSGKQPEPTQIMKPEETRMQPSTPTSPKLGKLTPEESSSIIEKTENLMEFFQDQEKQKDLVKRSTTKKRPKKPRTPSPSPVRQSIGLDHLDNLVRLMEQLSNLRDENVRLKSKCDYLESTKTLLQAKSSLDDDVLIIYTNSLPRMKKGKSQSTKSSKSDGGAVSFTRPRLSSAEDASIEFLDSASDQAPKRTFGKMYKRSFSTGSLEVPSDILEQSGDDDLSPRGLLENPFELKHGLRVSKSPETKRKSKFSKWAKVKKVINKQQLTENISSGITSGLRSIKGLGKGAYMRYGSISGRELAVPNVAESRSVDSGVGSGMDGELQDVRKSTSSGEPPSPTRFIERHIDVPTPQVDECMGIWLGPPEWIEKEREREQQLMKETESPKSEPSEVGSPHSLGFEDDSDKFLQVAAIPRRQSSPLLADEYTEEEPEEDQPLRRTASCKEPEAAKIVEPHEESKSEKAEPKKHKTPWGKMKTIMHTGSRKDSIKKKHHRKGRESDSFGFEEVSETDLEVYDEIKYIHEGYLEGPVGRSTPKTSPVVFRQKHRDKSLSASPPSKTAESAGKVPTMSGGTIDVSALLGGVSDEFTRKLQEWEELKGKRTSSGFKESSEFSESVSYDSAGPVSPEFQKKLEELEAEKIIKEKKLILDQEIESSSDETEDVSTPPERQRTSVNLEEMQRKISDSFSRKMEEWEKQKYQRHMSSVVDARDTPPQKSSFKDRAKSKKTKEEKEREKLEKMRERELMRVEREEQKLEKERMRIEKERLKALEREAKIEKMKGRLSQPDMEAQLKNPVLSPLQEYKVTADFARKLHEWEVRKGKDSSSTALYLEAHKRSLQFATEYQNAANMLSKNGDDTTGHETTDTDDATQMRKTSSESDELFLIDEPEKKLPVTVATTKPKVKGQKPPPLTLIPCFDSPEVSPGAPMSDESSLDDQSTETVEGMTQANIHSLEKANGMLLEQLRQKEMEYYALQEDVRDLNEQVIVFRDQHAIELDSYKKQLLEGFPSGEMSLDTKNMSTTLSHLENKIVELQKFGEQLAMSMEGAAIGKFQTVEGEESINQRLVDLLDKMRVLLQQANFSGKQLAENTLEEVSQKSSALRDFEKLYSQAMQLQVQMNNLRLSQLERNKEIMTMKRHLLVQEANNLLLQADVTRREAELLHYREYAQRRVPIKRWNTYSGKEDRQRDFSPKETVFQRVQRLRSARIISSTTDSDSDVPSKSPHMPHRESPRVRKRESPKSRRKESPKSRKKESPSAKRREAALTKIKESPRLARQKESPRLAREPIPESPVYERETERREEHVRQSSTKLLAESRQEGERSLQFSTVALPTAKLTLPKDISPHEMNGVPRRSSKGSAKHDTPADKATDDDTYSKDISRTREQTAKALGPKFPELLIPEWKKKVEPVKKSSLRRMPSIERDEVFESDNEVIVESSAKALCSEKEFGSKSKVEEGMRIIGDISFDSSETSEDTLKYLSPEASPAPRFEPPKFPTEITVIRKTAFDGETASDPGASRPTSLIKVSVASTTPTLLRKPPFGRIQSTRLNIPVIPLRRIKPAQELLEDSQRYRSGHSIYLTRILKRYPMKLECRSRTIEQQQADKADKENIKQGHVKSIIEKMSREGTPESKSSPKTSTAATPGEEMPRSEFVHQIVRKLSTPSGPIFEKTLEPLTDLTNDGQVRTLKEAFANGTPETEHKYPSVVIKGKDSQEPLHSHTSSSSTSTLNANGGSGAGAQMSPRTGSGNGAQNGSQIGSNGSKLTYSSMPMLSLEGDDSVMRERSATTSRTSGSTTPTQGPSYSPKDSPSAKHKIHVAVSLSPGRSRRVIDPNMSPARLRRLMDPASPGRRRRFRETTPIEQVLEEPCEASVTFAQSQTSPSAIEKSEITVQSPKLKKDKPKKGTTLGAMVRGSMTFDLGVTMQGASADDPGPSEARSQTLPVRHSTSSTTSTSSMSEIEGATGGTIPKEKKKSRHKFLDSSFMQKSRKFFKVSKENRCPSLECCGSDREVKKF